MLTYEKSLTPAICTEINVYEPNNVVSQSNNGMAVGNDADGIAKYFYIKLPSDRPIAASITSAYIKLAQSTTGTTTALTVKCSPVTGTGWNTSTTWGDKPAFNNAVYTEMTINSESGASTYDSATDYRTGYHAGYYVPGDYVPAYYDTYARYRIFDITTIYQYMLANNLDSIVFWFDTSGANGTHKYFYNPNNSDTKLRPLLTINYELLPAPSKPTINTIGTVTTGSKTFDWSDSTDTGGFFASNELYYEMQIWNGSAWGATQTSTQGSSQYTIDLKNYFSLQTGQYYYNTGTKIRVRAKTPLYSGVSYYSDWVEAAFTIDYRIVPTAPTISVDNSTPYEGQVITFTCGRPTSYNTHTASGAANQLTYYIELPAGTARVNDSAAVTAATKDIAYTAGNLTSGLSDLSVNVRVKCVDSEGQTSVYSTNLAMTLKRFRAPVINLGQITRGETTATIPFTIQDTGFGTQVNTQIRKIQYDIGGGYVDGTIGTWTGLTNTLTISGLTAVTRYTVSVKAVNVAPTGMTDKTSTTAFVSTILEYTPAFAVLPEGAHAKSMHVGADNSVTPDPGCVLVDNDVDIGGEYKIDGVSLISTGALSVSVQGDGVAGTGWNISLSANKYTKIGNVVHVIARIQVTTKSANATGNVIITGLPFNSDATNYQMECGTQNVTFGTGYTRLMATTTSGNSNLSLYQIDKSASALTALPIANIANGSVFYLHGTYFA